MKITTAKIINDIEEYKAETIKYISDLDVLEYTNNPFTSKLILETTAIYE